ncbi:hypothetical protein LSH36_550g01000 [Paralvinella palmiformis]|uniref:RING-type domain-containing protein n=1 Tax=Paralvinella palmiformis TaxID=53620 RepID=A0AAD9MYB4_9ANNE|nr:hypothetical protein LSH36_550g01000 [Paralvinella palmiformis]
MSAEVNHREVNGSNEAPTKTEEESSAPSEEELLICPICQGEFNEPKMLPCLHTFCSDCLTNSLEQSNIDIGQAFLCPICRHQCFVPLRGPAGFKDNIFYVTLQEFYDRKTLNPDQACEACDSGNPAKRQCLQCNDWLCSKCCAMHQRVRMTSGHTLLSPKDLRNGKMDELIKQNFEPLLCSNHGEPLRLFCVSPTCMAPICTVCKTTAGHDNHPAIELSAQAVKEAKTIKALMPGLNKSVTAMATKIDNLKHEEKLTSHVRKKIHKVINDRVEEIVQKFVQQINDYAEGLHQDVEKLVKEHRKEVAKELDTYSFKLKSIEGAKTFTEALLDFNRAEELVSMSKEVKQRLEEFQRPIDASPPSWRQPRLHPPEEVDNGVIASMFGQLTFEGEIVKTQILHTFSAKLDDDEKNCALCDISVDDEDMLLVVDRDNRKIKFFDICGNVIYHTGEETLRAPNRLVHLSKTGRLLVKDDKCLKLLNRDGSFVTNFAEHLKQPVGLTCNREGEVLVTDWMSGCVHVFDELGGSLHNFPTATEAAGYITTANDGTVIVSDWKQHSVKVFDSKGGIKREYGEYGSGLGQLDHPYGVATDRYGHILIADTWNNRIHMLSKDGKFERFLLTKEDGLSYPQTLIVNRKGQLIIVEQQGTVKIYQYMA